MASGVNVSAECIDRFERVRMKGSDKLPYMVMKIEEEKGEEQPDQEEKRKPKKDKQHPKGKHVIVLDKDLSTKDFPDFQCLLRELPKNDGRYIVYDHPFKSQAGANSERLLLAMWCPQEMHVKLKMLYASSKQAVKCAFHNATLKDMEGGCCDDFTEDVVQAKLK